MLSRYRSDTGTLLGTLVDEMAEHARRGVRGERLEEHERHNRGDEVALSVHVFGT